MTADRATVTTTTPQEGMTLEEVKAAIWKAMQQAGRDLLTQTAHAMKTALLQCVQPLSDATSQAGRDF